MSAGGGAGDPGRAAPDPPEAGAATWQGIFWGREASRGSISSVSLLGDDPPTPAGRRGELLPPDSLEHLPSFSRPPDGDPEPAGRGDLAPQESPRSPGAGGATAPPVGWDPALLASRAKEGGPPAHPALPGGGLHEGGGGESGADARADADSGPATTVAASEEGAHGLANDQRGQAEDVGEGAGAERRAPSADALVLGSAAGESLATTAELSASESEGSAPVPRGLVLGLLDQDPALPAAGGPESGLRSMQGPRLPSHPPSHANDDGAVAGMHAEVESPWGPSERRRIVCTVVRGRHLPKKDVFGTCDAFVTITFNEQEERTGVRQGTYDPDFGESLELGWVRRMPEGVLRVRVFDDDKGSGDDLIGEATIGASVLFRRVIGEESEMTLSLSDEAGEQVLGKDKYRSEVTLCLRVERSILGLVALAPEQPAWEPNEKRRLVLTVVSGRHMPKKDTAGSCDPVCAVTLHGEEHRTHVEKKTYDPVWDERLELGWVGGASEALGCGELCVCVYDHDALIGSDFIGEAVVDGGVGFLRMVGEESEVCVELVDKEGRSVIGHDGQVCEVVLRVGLERTFGAALEALDAEPAWAANERRRVVCTVVHGRNMPKKDLLGTCDPYAVVSLAGTEGRTSVRKGTYDPDFGECIELGWSRRMPVGVLHVTMFDDDAVTGDDVIGEATLEASLLFRRVIGEESDLTLGLLDKSGAPVEGEEKHRSEVKLRVRLEQSFVGLVALASEQEAWEPNEMRRLVLTVVSGRHMPKKDTMGSCDPVCIVSLLGEEYRTHVEKGTYDPVWDERLELGWVTGADHAAEAGQLVVRVVDHDMVTGEDFIGEAAVDGGVGFLRKVGEESDVCVELVDKEGRAVVGQDGHACEVLFRLTVERAFGAALEALDVEEAWVPNERRRVVCTVVHGRNMPKKDLLGSCDAYAVVSLDGKQGRTSVRKGTYDPDFDEVLELGWTRQMPGGTMRVRLMDQDALTGDDLIGEATVDATLLFRQVVGSESEVILPLIDSKGRQIYGQEKHRSEVKLRVCLERTVVGLAALRSEQEAWEPNEKRRIVATVVSGRHMPKKDTMGSCDPVCVLELLGEEHRTHVEKGTYDPVWDERLELGWVTGADEAAAVGKLLVRVVDHDLVTGEDFIGEAVLDAGLAFFRNVGQENEAVVELCDQAGKAVVGKDGFASEVQIRFGMERMLPPIKALAAEEAWEPNERRRIVCTVVHGRSMPKKDTFGSCDPFAVVSLDGHEERTSVRKGTYDPDFDEVLELQWTRQTPGGVLCVRLMDHDALTGEDYIGEAVVDSSLLYRQVLGVDSEATLPLVNGDELPVFGKDGHRSEVKVRLRLERSILGLVALAPEQETWVANEKRRLVVTVLSGRHMPKKDTMGSCDPVCAMTLLEEEQRTHVEKGTYDPVWDERLEFGWVSGVSEAAGCGELCVRVYDHDALSGSDFIGEAVVDGGVGFLRKVGEESEVCVELVDEEGRAVVGHDGKASEISFRVLLQQNLSNVMSVAIAELEDVPHSPETAADRRARELIAILATSRDIRERMRCSEDLKAHVAAERLSPKCALDVLKAALVLLSEGSVYAVSSSLSIVDSLCSLANAECMSLAALCLGSELDRTRESGIQAFLKCVVAGQDFIGEAALDSRTVFMQKVGQDYEMCLGLMDREGRKVLGHDGGACEVNLRICVEKGFKNGAPEEPWAANERRRVVCTVVHARHLPKKDTIGSCDAFAIVSLDGKEGDQVIEGRTSVRKGSFDPDFGDILELGWVRRMPQGVLRVRMMDDDSMTKSDLIGEATLDTALLFRRVIGQENETILKLVDKTGKAVVGEDTCRSEVTVRVRLERSILGLVALAPEQEAWEPNEKRRLVLTVVCGRHMPKKDTAGSCDPVCAVTLLGEEYRTHVEKATYDPVWDERLELGWVGGASQASGCGELCVRVYDHDALSGADFVGEALLDGGVGFLRKVGEESEVCVELVDKEGRSVVGHDGQVCEVVLRVRLERTFGAALEALDAEPAWVPNERRRVVCTVVHGRNMPKKDLMGTCDAYAVVSLGGAEGRTSVRKGTYDPDFGECIELGWVRRMPGGVLRVRMMDADAITGDDVIGEATLEASLLFRRVIGEESEATLGLLDKREQPLFDKEKHRSEVKLRVRLERSFVGLVALAPEQEPWVANEKRRLVLTVVSGRHMPKKDAAGSCDPVCAVTLLGEEYRTHVEKATYDPVWGDRLELAWVTGASEAAGCGELCVRVYDHDALSGADFIGEAVLDGGVGFLRKVGEENEVCVELVDKEGRSVVGHDGQVCEVVFRLGLERGMLGLSALDGEEAWAANERRRVVLTVVSARHMPKKDLMGSCDPYAVVSLDGKEVRTNVRKGTYDPDFDEVLELGWTRQMPGGVLLVRMFDDDKASGADLIGEATIQASSLFRRVIGQESEISLELLDDHGRIVLGKDTRRSEVKVRVRLERSFVGLVALAPEQEVWEPNEKRRLVLTVVNGRHMPKTDTMGSCDPVCAVSLLGEEYRTHVEKGTYDPVWDERLELGWVGGADEAVGCGDLCVRVYDHDVLSGADFVGEALLDGGVGFLRKVGEESEVCVELVDKEGQAVVGHDGQVCEVVLRVWLERSFGAALEALDAEPAWAANERRRVVCTVVHGRNMPRKDLMGTCDAYAVISLDGTEVRTKVRRGTYDPDFGECIELGWVRRVPDGVLRVTMLDDDAITGDDLIGEATLQASLLFRRVIREESEVTLGLVDKSGSPVLGKEKHRSEVKLRVRLERSFVGLVALASEQETWVANEKRWLVLTVVSGRHMPKKDTMGSCDPVCAVSLLGEEYRTHVEKATYDPVWDERLELGWVGGASEASGCGELCVRVYDHDALSGADFIGEAVLDGGVGFLRKVGEESEVCVELVDKEGRSVVGHDGQVCEVVLRVRLERTFGAALEALDAEPAWVPNERRRVVCTVVHGRNMPKKDLMGTCDAYAVVSLGGAEGRTSVRKGTYDPDFGECIELGWVRRMPGGVLRVRMMDADAITGDDVIGEATLEASLLFRRVIGEESEVTLGLVDKSGEPVLGEEKHRSEVKLRFKLERLLPDLSDPSGILSFAPNERRRMVVVVVSGRHLPKVDALGLCDSCVTLSLQGRLAKTSTKHNTLSPDWGERFDFEWLVSQKDIDDLGPLVVRLTDDDSSKARLDEAATEVVKVVDEIHSSLREAKDRIAVLKGDRKALEAEQEELMTKSEEYFRTHPESRVPKDCDRDIYAIDDQIAKEVKVVQYHDSKIIGVFCACARVLGGLRPLGLRGKEYGSVLGGWIDEWTGEDRGASVRQTCLEVLVGLCERGGGWEKEATTVLIGCLDDSSAAVRKVVAWGLPRLCDVGDAPVQDALWVLVCDSVAEVYLVACASLFDVCGGLDETLVVLSRKLDSAEVKQRRAAARGLLGVFRKAEEEGLEWRGKGFGIIMCALEDKEVSVRLATEHVMLALDWRGGGESLGEFLDRASEKQVVVDSVRDSWKDVDALSGDLKTFRGVGWRGTGHVDFGVRRSVVLGAGAYVRGGEKVESLQAGLVLRSRDDDERERLSRVGGGRMAGRVLPWMYAELRGHGDEGSEATEPAGEQTADQSRQRNQSKPTKSADQPTYVRRQEPGGAMPASVGQVFGALGQGGCDTVACECAIKGSKSSNPGVRIAAAASLSRLLRSEVFCWRESVGKSLLRPEEIGVTGRGGRIGWARPAQTKDLLGALRSLAGDETLSVRMAAEDILRALEREGFVTADELPLPTCHAQRLAAPDSRKPLPWSAHQGPFYPYTWDVTQNSAPPPEKERGHVAARSMGSLAGWQASQISVTRFGR